ncbi:ABC transporter permease [Nocardioides daeguensis]|uniref:Transport permease protein n=1 Tax=Nocardioides daeguensis TaxID=908359 RepID=A0ABP6UX18_9ACTN|nr:ABC transporter permease [Nocardioides daeguensis]MBV6726958.1 ABC transporter permease [Nocardioides daeguensis]MCR1771638.1 ABC transporter permease [Nocardioides daeguensis]
MTPRVTLAIAVRVLTQLRRDHRTLAMLLLVPCLLQALLWWIFWDQPLVFDRIGPALLAIFPFFVMFLVTSITTLRERSGGTLERLFTMPMGRLDFLVGYALAFGAIAAVQAALAAGVAVGLLDLDLRGPDVLLVLVGVVDAVLGTALGLFVSAFARTEFQAVQFLPAIVVPQILLCGLIVPRDRLPRVLERIADVMPLTWAVDAMEHLATTARTGAVWRDLGIVVAFAVAALALGAATLRRRTE